MATEHNRIADAAIGKVSVLEGAGLVQDVGELATSVASGQWAGGFASLLSAGFTVKDMIQDPLAKLISMGLGWAIEFFELLNAWLDWLTVDQEQLTVAAETWSGISAELRGVARDLDGYYKTDSAAWAGDAVDLLRRPGRPVQRSRGSGGRDGEPHQPQQDPAHHRALDRPGHDHRRGRQGHQHHPAPPAAGDWRQPSLEEVSSTLRNSLKRVGDAVKKCSSAGDTALAGARRELAGALSGSMTRLEDLGRDVAPTSRIHGMARLTAVELVTMAQRYLTFDFVITDQLSLREISGLVRETLARQP